MNSALPPNAVQFMRWPGSMSAILCLAGLPWAYFVGSYAAYIFFYTEGSPRGTMPEAVFCVFIAGLPSLAEIAMGIVAIRRRHHVEESLIRGVIGLVGGVLWMAVIIAGMASMVSTYGYR